MKVFRGLYAKIKSFQLEKYLYNNINIDPKEQPIDLICELQQNNYQERLFDIFNRRQSEGLIQLRKLTIIHLILFHKWDMWEYFQDYEFENKVTDKWLLKEIIEPYSQFLKKILHSMDLYKTIQVNKTLEFDLQKLFYCVKIMKDLFAVVKKISVLARYYLTNDEKLKNRNRIVNNFVDLFALHAQQLYNFFKIVILEIIKYPQKYIQGKEQKIIIKYILEEELIRLNDFMKNLFLDRYFYPYSKGYVVKLLKLEELKDAALDYINSLYLDEFNEIVEKRRQKKKKALNSLLFDEKGRLNSQLCKTLNNISVNGDENFPSVQGGNYNDPEIMDRRMNKRSKRDIEYIEEI